MNFRMALASLLTVLCCSCSRHEPVPVTWEQLIRQLYAPESIADISQPCTDIRTSYDRSGGNNDFSNGYKDLGNGWLELANFSGPGVLTRFWFTGIWKARIRFVFDDGDEPQVEMTWDDLYEGRSSFPESFMSMDQNCFYSGFPVPYRKRLRILVSDEGYSQGKGKLFFQINATRLKDRLVHSAVFPVPQTVRDAAEGVFDSFVPQGKAISSVFTVSGNAKQEVLALQSGGVVRKLRIELDGWEDMNFQQRRSLLRQLWLRISWDGSQLDSVHAPVGDFFGQMWEPKKLHNAYFSVDDTGFNCLFPMPFKASALIALDNQGETSVSGKVSLVHDPRPVPSGYGYFHSGWLSTPETFDGSPHQVLYAEGRGRLAGCLLGVASMDRSFWVLESDETILRDQSKEVFWQGTGLEDYFNGGWYYRTVFQTPLYGLTTKRPFRTVQYRFHLADPVTFDTSLDMSFERGQANGSRAAFDSIVYYYLEHPSPAPESRFLPASPAPPKDEFRARSLMTRLWDYEKFNDSINAKKLTQHAVQFWNYPPSIAALLNLRILAYQAEINGYETVRERLHALSASDSSDADTLIRYYEQNATLLFVYSSKETAVYLDEKPVAVTSDPIRSQVIAINLPPGRHVLAVETEAKNWPDWVQVGMKRDGHIMGIDSSWACTTNPTGEWKKLEYDDASWNLSINLCKGPPEQEAIPFVYPDAYPRLQSQVDGVRAQQIAPAAKKVFFRKAFEAE